MSGARFIRQLRKELPDWQSRGWVTPEAAAAILAHLEGQAARPHLFAYGLAILGVLLLGSGVITWFAANWAGMAKITKLIVLLGALYAAYGAAGWCLHRDRSPKIGQALLLLGVILFGANIMLIAQIYHIEEHYPNGILFWALGGLATAYLFRSQPALIATIVLGILWSGTESYAFDEAHWQFLVLWMALLPLIVLERWRLSLSMAMRALLLWSLFFFTSLGVGDYARLLLLQIYALAFFAIFTIGMLMETFPRLADFAPPVRESSLAGALIAFLVLTFPEVQDDRGAIAHEGAWIALTFVVLGILFGLAFWHRVRSGPNRPRYLRYADWLIGAGILLVVANLFIPAKLAIPMAIAFNLLYFVTTFWLLMAGLNLGSRYVLNCAFVFFAAGLLCRYFDTFWTLLDRSYFFMAGGVILIVGGWFLEQQRRRLTAQISPSSPPPDRGRGQGWG